MIKNGRFYAGLTLLGMLLVSCGGGNSSAESSSPVVSSESAPSSSVSSSVSSSSSSSSNKYANYKRLEDFSKGVTTYSDMAGNEYPLTRQILETNSGTPCLTPLGEQRILVVPLGLDDDDEPKGPNDAYPTVSKSGRTEKQTAERLQQIENLFFGKAEDTGWQSVKSYYETASYGKCTITGSVMTQDGGWFRPGRKPKGYGSREALNDIKQFYTSEYAKENHGALGADAKDWKWYDQDRDGYIDTIWIVYSAPIHAWESSSTSMEYWAYVSRTGNRANKSDPNPMCYAWASIDFMDKAYGEGLDGHTFIHETGHIFGIDDYYNYEGTSSPLGGVDMQDHNIGDQNAFSKWQFGWTSPYVVDENAYIELEPTTLSGNSVIIPSPDFNGTCYDEYFLIEAMAPVGLCEQDYKQGYENVTGYTKPGLRITHVDARTSRGSQSDGPYYTPEDVATCSQMRVMNTPNGRGYATYRDTFDNPATGTSRPMYMINTIQASGFSKDHNLLTQSLNSGNDDLFTKGFSFDLEPYYDTTLKQDFNDFYYFMPSYSNLWNKAQDVKTREVDDSCTVNFSLTVLDASKEKVSFIIEYK